MTRPWYRAGVRLTWVASRVALAGAAAAWMQPSRAPARRGWSRAVKPAKAAAAIHPITATLVCSGSRAWTAGAVTAPRIPPTAATANSDPSSAGVVPALVRLAIRVNVAAAKTSW